MNYFKYTQQQYTINILRQPTLIIFSPKVIKKTLLFDVYTKMQGYDINVQLVNTKFIKNLINNSKFQFLQPLINGPIMMASSNKKISQNDLTTVIGLFEDKLTFNGALLNNNVFVTQQRLEFIKKNPNNELLMFFITYNLYILTLLLNNKPKNN
jgi:hypothetical protein